MYTFSNGRLVVISMLNRVVFVRALD